MDENSEGLLAIAFFCVDARPAIILDDVVGYLDALGTSKEKCLGGRYPTSQEKVFDKRAGAALSLVPS
jgi:hypothetical protein